MSRGAGDRARTRMLAAIHAEKKSIGMDDDVYRDMLARVSADHGDAQRSAANLNHAQLDAVLGELRRLSGRTFDVQKDRPASSVMAERPLLRKIGALLAHGRKPWGYGHAIAKRMGFGDRLEFARDDQLRAVVAALATPRRHQVGRNKESARQQERGHDQG